jgi:hypothetical protein
MGWRSISKTGEIRYEGHPDPELGGRPVDQGEEGALLVIEQSDFGHRVCVDLVHGIVLIDYEEDITLQGNTLEAKNPKTVLFACDDTNILNEYKHLNQELVLARDEMGRKVHDDKGNLVKVRNDHLVDLKFRPIWFTRFTNGIPTKVIGLQTTTPVEMGSRNVKLLVSLFADGKIGISGER